MEYYSAIQRDKLLMHTTALGDLKGIRLWEVLEMMKLLCILTVVVVRHIYTCDKMLDEGFTGCLCTIFATSM